MILDHTPIATPLTEHPSYRTRHELLSVPLSSPRLAEACVGRQFIVRESANPDDVVLRAGTHVWCAPGVKERIEARMEGRRIIREGYTDVLAWLGEAP